MTPNIEDIVRADPHVVAIVPSGYCLFPLIDYELWGNARNTAENIVNIIKEYLLLQYIIDDFESNHNERRVWRSEQEKAHPGFEDYYRQNALKWNKYSITQTAIDLLLTLYGGPDKEKALQVGQSFQEKSDTKYNQKTTTEKIEWVREKKKQMYAMLELISRQEQ